VGVGLEPPDEVEVAVNLAGVEAGVDLAGIEGPGTVLAGGAEVELDFATSVFVGAGFTVPEGAAGVAAVGAACFLRRASAMMRGWKSKSLVGSFWISSVG
jgi:hypothetical protein